MKKTTKGALATTAAVALLAGGAGSLAFWNADAVVPGNRIHVGQLKLIDGPTGSTCADQSFTFADGQPYSEINPNITRVVPGDVLTKTCSFTVRAIGENLTANLSTVNAAAIANSAVPLNVASSFTIDGATTSSITSADNGKVLQAKIVVQFPFGSSADNTSQGPTNKVVTGYTVTATQTAP